MVEHPPILPGHRSGNTRLADVKVLCIDGGGIRGLIPALVLAEIERRTGRRIAEMVDFVAGTSTGGILACALTRPGAGRAPAVQRGGARRHLRRGGAADLPPLACSSACSPRAAGSTSATRTTGWSARWSATSATRCSPSLEPIFVTAYDIHDRFAFFFRSARAARDPTYDFPLAAVARATSAAPTYFEPEEVTDRAGARTYPLIDGGIYAVNPSMCAYADVVRDGRAGELQLMLSLGTGAQTRAYTYEQARWWGQLGWARPALDMVFDGVVGHDRVRGAGAHGRALHPPADHPRARVRRPRRRVRGQSRRPTPRGRAADRRLGTLARPGLCRPCRLTRRPSCSNATRELATLDDLVAGAAGGSGRLVLIEGPAGIGKSGLLAGLRERAQPALHVLQARAGELEREFAYGVVRQLFEARVAARGELTGAAAPAAALFETAATPAQEGAASFAALHAPLLAHARPGGGAPRAARDRRPALDGPALAALPRLPRAAAGRARRCWSPRRCARASRAPIPACSPRSSTTPRPSRCGRVR